MANTYTKINTFSRTPSPAQIASYAVIALQCIAFFGFIQHNYESETTRIVLIVLFSCSVTAIIITTFISSYIDPSDSIMIQCAKGNHSKFSSQIDDLLYCDYCQAYVKQNSRHCRQCDRCVENFDHHCMWINNCVGSKNYQAFLSMITSVFVNLVIYIISVIFLTVENAWQNILGFMIPSWVILAIISIFCLLVMNLIILHIYLMCKGYTTYQFIVARRQEERLEKLRELDEKKMIEEEKNKKNYENFKKQREQKKMEQEKSKSKFKVVELESQENVSKIQIGKISHIEDQQSKQVTKYDESSKKKLVSESDQVVFFEKQVTQKSIGDVESNKGEQKKKDSQEKIDSSEENDSVRISQFFMRNKSLNLFIHSGTPAKPHKKMMNVSAYVSQDKKQKKNEKINMRKTTGKN